MKITLISPYYDITNPGLRTLSSCLKKAGHDSQMVFLPQAWGGTLNDFLVYESERTINDLVDICSDSDMIGITLMTNYFFRVSSLTRRLKEHLDKPVVWGGVHPTIRPEECLEYADIVCISEGDLSFVELCNRLEEGKDYSDMSGIGFKQNGKMIRNDPRNFVQDLDLIPHPDYSTKDSFILDKDALVPMEKNLLHQAMLRGMTIDEGEASLQIITSRGCPLNCSYCANNIFRRLTKGKYLRARSPEHIIKELKDALSTMDFVKSVWISDDTFISRSFENLKAFVEIYKKEINLPFFCLGDPLHITEEKMELLCDGGLRLMTMGIQTGAENTKRLYNRPIPNDKVLKATKIISQFTTKIKFPMYDIIVDNPYETRSDEYETVQLVSRIPRPYYLQLFSLTFFPESSLYKRAVKNGIVTDEYEQIYNKPFLERGTTYHTMLLRLYNHKLPMFAMKILSSRPIYFFLSMKIFNSFYSAVYKMIKGWQNKGAGKKAT